MNRTFQAIRDEAAATVDPVALWKLNQEIGAKYKRNAEKAAFAGMMPGGADIEHEWLMNKAPVHGGLCQEVAAMLGRALEGKSTAEIVEIATRAA